MTGTEDTTVGLPRTHPQLAIRHQRSPPQSAGSHSTRNRHPLFSDRQSVYLLCAVLRTMSCTDVWRTMRRRSKQAADASPCREEPPYHIPSHPHSISLPSPRTLGSEHRGRVRRKVWERWRALLFGPRREFPAMFWVRWVGIASQS